MSVWAVSLLVIGVVCCIRWNGLTFESIWSDEAFSIELARQNWLDVIRGTAVDQHPPLYYLLLKLWMTTGVSVFQLRFLSTIADIIEIALVLAWGRKILGLQAGVIAGVSLALIPLHVRYAQYVRMYSLVSLLCTLSSILLYRFINKKKTLFALAILNVLALYTHNVAIFSVGVQFFLIIYFSARSRDWALAKQWIQIHLFLGLLYVPWLFVLYNQATRNSMSWIGPLTPTALVKVITQLTSGDVIISQGTVVSDIWLGFWLLLILVGIGRAQSRQKQAIYLAFWFFGGLLSMFLTSQFIRFFSDKLLIWLLTPLVLLAANGIQQLSTVWRKVVVVGVIIGFLTSALFVQQAKLEDQDCRGVAQLLAQQVLPRDAVLFNAGVTSICVKVYGGMTYPFVTIPENYSILESGYQGNKVTPKVASRIVTKLESEYQRLWLVEFWPYWWDPEGYIEARINRSSTLDQEWQFRGLRVKYYRLKTVP